MFEKEAQRSFDELDDRGVGDDWSIEESYVNGFSNGSEFGYNKANEWHYPSKGDYPKDEFADEYTKYRLPSTYKRSYCLCLGDDCVVGKYIRGLFWTVEGQYSLNEIVAWKDIVLPEISKEVLHD